jgi:hypothetical protein
MNMNHMNTGQLRKHLAVWDYLGISQEEFRKRVLYGSCVKCGQTARDKSSCLCVNHTRAFHRWQTLTIRKKIATEHGHS